MMDFLRTAESHRTISPLEARANLKLVQVGAKWSAIGSIVAAVLAVVAMLIFR